MKSFLIQNLAIAAVFASCSVTKNVNETEATVTRDCTGTYLQMEGKDYLVCNNKMLKPYKDGQKVKAVFEKINDCPELDGTAVCMMYHENEGMIRIKTVK